MRNFQLYGDFLALRASQAIWGRGDSLSVAPRDVLAEAQGIYYAQADGETAGFPTSAWVPNYPFEDVRPLKLSANAAALFVGWYDAENGIRLSADPNPRGDDLWVVALN